MPWYDIVWYGMVWFLNEKGAIVSHIDFNDEIIPLYVVSFLDVKGFDYTIGRRSHVGLHLHGR